MFCTVVTWHPTLSFSTLTVESKTAKGLLHHLVYRGWHFLRTMHLYLKSIWSTTLSRALPFTMQNLPWLNLTKLNTLYLSKLNSTYLTYIPSRFNNQANFHFYGVTQVALGNSEGWRRGSSQLCNSAPSSWKSPRFRRHLSGSCSLSCVACMIIIDLISHYFQNIET